jgi:hypothetical protein
VARVKTKEEEAENEAAEEEVNVKYKDPNKGIRPTKEDTVDSDDLTLEDGPVQEGEEKKLLKCNICGKRFINNLAWRDTWRYM